jgi:hypothetical protein
MNNLSEIELNEVFFVPGHFNEIGAFDVADYWAFYSRHGFLRSYATETAADEANLDDGGYSSRLTANTG